MEPWSYSYPAEIIVCDGNGIILEMNAAAIQLYEHDGGKALIGTNVFSHHSESTRSQVKQVTDGKKQYVYTTEKNHQKKLVTISPWEQNGAYAGFVLWTIDLPSELPNINKD
jgi:transcriptional regulator with PAS, ATPase and Fis domain